MALLHDLGMASLFHGRSGGAGKPRGMRCRETALSRDVLALRIRLFVGDDVDVAIATNSAHQRLRVFVSSTTEDLSTERAAARAAIENLRLHPILIDLDARAYPASRGDLTEVDDSDIFIAIYGERYGSASGGEVSDLEGEYVAAGEKPKLIYLKSSSPERDPRLTDMIERITESAAVSYKSFNDARELQELIENDLATLLSEAYDAHPTQPPPVPEVRVEARLPSDVTSFVGREDEVRAIHDLLRSKGARLVTITGPGGVGKSRVAIRAARSFVAEMEVSFVELARRSDDRRAVGGACVGREPVGSGAGAEARCRTGAARTRQFRAGPRCRARRGSLVEEDSASQSARDESCRPSRARGMRVHAGTVPHT
jgi:hypothetical protein